VRPASPIPVESRSSPCSRSVPSQPSSTSTPSTPSCHPASPSDLSLPRWGGQQANEKLAAVLSYGIDPTPVPEKSGSASPSPPSTA
jgi:hypothetical protein